MRDHTAERAHSGTKKCIMGRHYLASGHTRPSVMHTSSRTPPLFMLAGQG